LEACKIHIGNGDVEYPTKSPDVGETGNLYAEQAQIGREDLLDPNNVTLVGTQSEA